jgi:hypothetical protein
VTLAVSIVSRVFGPPEVPTASKSEAQNGRRAPLAKIKAWCWPKLRFVSALPMLLDWLSAVGPKTSAWPVIALVGAIGILAKVWGEKVLPPSMLVVTYVA